MPKSVKFMVLAGSSFRADVPAFVAWLGVALAHVLRDCGFTLLEDLADPQLAARYDRTDFAPGADRALLAYRSRARRRLSRLA